MRKILSLFIVLFILTMSIAAQDMKPLLDKDLIVVEREVAAPTEEEAIDEAARQAVQSCCGRVYFSDKLLMARSLLVKYIDNYYEEFVYSTVVDEKKDYGDSVEMRIKTFVNYSDLLADLEEKGFIFRPRIRPFFSVFLKETIDGESSDQNQGAENVRNAWKDLTGQRDPDDPITIPPSNMNILESPALKDEAIRAAQKNEVEVILSGTLSSNREKREELYYQTYTFYRTVINLSLMRVDNGEVLDEVTVSALAGSDLQSQAIQLSITRAARKAAQKLSEHYLENWDKTILNKGDYIFMFTGVDDVKMDLIKKKLGSMDDSSEAFVKSRFADVAVVNYVYEGPRERLIEAIEKSSYPRMHILMERDNRYEIQIKN